MTESTANNVLYGIHAVENTQDFLRWGLDWASLHEREDMREYTLRMNEELRSDTIVWDGTWSPINRHTATLRNIAEQEAARFDSVDNDMQVLLLRCVEKIEAIITYREERFTAMQEKKRQRMLEERKQHMIDYSLAARVKFR